MIAQKTLKIFIILVLSLFILFCFIFNKKENSENLVFWTLQLSEYSQYFNDLILEFEKNNPDIKIQWIDIPYSEGEKRTLASLLSDNPPDLINLNPDFTAIAAQKNAILEIPNEYLHNFSDNLLESLKYNNKIYSIPFYATSAITYANTKLSKGYIPKTYIDLYNNAQNIAQKNKYIEMPCLCENDTLLKILNKYNINYYDIAKSKTLFDMYKNAIKKEFIPKESLTCSHREALEKFMSGQTAFLVAGANFINLIKENSPDIYNNLEIYPQLTGYSDKYDYSLMNLIIPMKSKRHEQALKFSEFLTNEKNQTEFAKITGVIPVNQYSLNKEYSSNYQTKEEYARHLGALQLKNPQKQLENNIYKKYNTELVNTAFQESVLGNLNYNELQDKIKE